MLSTLCTFEIFFRNDNNKKKGYIKSSWGFQPLMKDSTGPGKESVQKVIFLIFALKRIVWAIPLEYKVCFGGKLPERP